MVVTENDSKALVVSGYIQIPSLCHIAVCVTLHRSSMELNGPGSGDPVGCAGGQPNGNTTFTCPVGVGVR